MKDAASSSARSFAATVFPKLRNSFVESHYMKLLAIRMALAAALSTLWWPVGAQAVGLTCDEFKVGLTESSAEYKYGAPRYELREDAGRLQSWWVGGIFDDVKSSILCRNGKFWVFVVDTKSADNARAALHVGLLAGMALHAFGLDWPEALRVRDKLVSTRRHAEITKLPVDGGVASMAISIAGIGDFELKATP